MFRLPAQLSAPPLKSVRSTVCEHQAAGTCPTPQSVVKGFVDTAVCVTPKSEALPKIPAERKSTAENPSVANCGHGVQQVSTFSASKVSPTYTQAHTEESRSRYLWPGLMLMCTDWALEYVHADTRNGKTNTERMDVVRPVSETADKHQVVLSPQCGCACLVYCRCLLFASRLPLSTQPCIVFKRLVAAGPGNNRQRRSSLHRSRSSRDRGEHCEV